MACHNVIYIEARCSRDIPMGLLVQRAEFARIEAQSLG